MTRQTKQEIQYLLLQYLDAKATVKEEIKLFRLLEQEPGNTEWQNILEELMADETPGTFNKEEWLPVINNILNRTTPVRKINIFKRIAVAASILLIISLSSYFLFFNKSKTTDDGQQTIAITKDVAAPTNTKATITLADGRIISLDSLTSIAQDNVTVIKNANGEVVYTGAANEVVYNTLVNPRGSKIVNLTLSDGTKVWLNSESSLKYPTAFASNIRNVEITGEAYFEVAKNPANKFIVSGGGVTTEVLGTHFNVNTYTDEDDIKVTLLEGSVQVSAASAKNPASSAVKIKPGQQAKVVNSKLSIANGVDVEAVMAWKNDQFIFSGNNIQSVMRQLARWYNVEVSYEGSVPADEFVGVIPKSRYENISAILSMLEKTRTVSFTVADRKITVRPWKQ